MKGCRSPRAAARVATSRCRPPLPPPADWSLRSRPDVVHITSTPRLPVSPLNLPAPIVLDGRSQNRPRAPGPFAPFPSLLATTLRFARQVWQSGWPRCSPPRPAPTTRTASPRAALPGRSASPGRKGYQERGPRYGKIDAVGDYTRFAGPARRIPGESSPVAPRDLVAGVCWARPAA